MKHNIPSKTLDQVFLFQSNSIKLIDSNVFLYAPLFINCISHQSGMHIISLTDIKYLNAM